MAIDIEHNLSLHIRRLANACQNGRSHKWCLQLWSRYIKERDFFTCVVCGSKDRPQAHHIIRRSLYVLGAFQPGNGITLCIDCHRLSHSRFNGSADLSLPIDAQGGDDLDEATYFFKCLCEDSVKYERQDGLFYYIDDYMIVFFAEMHGYNFHADLDKISRIQMVYEIFSTSDGGVLNRLFSLNL
ncbi:HNH endonuclease [Pseudomonas syringae]|uniref:HNH endonuclease n=1 Tax=Pseudomonas syringae TaxID=317 RepID=UPI0011051679|nr:HNH endonuclease [Pseudomonas syringae pv. dysoxyli]TFZ38567.1 HNH endonuclease [Pseudomonas syringae]